MSWSQSKIRKWHRDNPGRSRYEAGITRAFRRNRSAMAANITKSNTLFVALMIRGR